MWAIAGLGNPGDKYENTRHNAGFWAIDYTRKKVLDAQGSSLSHPTWNENLGASFCKVSIAKTPALLIKPLKYMNRSGDVLQAFLSYYKIPASKLIVLHDELDFAPGVIRLKKNGSAGGHNGVADIIRAFGTDNFCRLRIGIGHPRNTATSISVESWVLTPPIEEDRVKINTAITLVTEEIEKIIKTFSVT